MGLLLWQVGLTTSSCIFVIMSSFFLFKFFIGNYSEEQLSMCDATAPWYDTIPLIYAFSLLLLRAISFEIRGRVCGFKYNIDSLQNKPFFLCDNHRTPFPHDMTQFLLSISSVLLGAIRGMGKQKIISLYGVFIYNIDSLHNKSFFLSNNHRIAWRRQVVFKEQQHPLSRFIPQEEYRLPQRTVCKDSAMPRLQIKKAYAHTMRILLETICQCHCHLDWIRWSLRLETVQA